MKAMSKVFLAVVVASAVGGCGKDKQQAGESSEFGICKKAMAAIARDPATVQVPTIEATETAENMVFEWSEKTAMLSMRNSKGLDVPVSGTCALSKATKKVTYVLMNGAMVH